MDIAEIRREWNRESPRSKTAVRITYGRNGEDLNKMMRCGRMHTEGLTRHARMGGIRVRGTCEMKWDEM